MTACDRSDMPVPIPVVDAADVIGPACMRGPAGDAAPPQSLEIEADPGRLCRAVAVRTGVELKPSVSGAHPDPYFFSVARASDGVFYTAATQASAPGTILVWEPDGSFRGRFGRPGEGPGELVGRSPGQLLIGPGDSVYVREAGRMSVFGPDGGFGRVLTAPAIGRRRGQFDLTEDGAFVSSAPVPQGEPGHWFHVADAEGRLRRSFGNLDRTGLPSSFREGERIPPRSIAYVGGGRFWAAPPPSAPGGYVLEEWTVQGELLQRLHRDVSWAEDRTGGDDGLMLPAFNLAVDEHGLLWVTAMAKDRRWSPLDREELRAAQNDAELMTELFDIRYEVINPSSGVLLASGLIDVVAAEDERDHPPIFRILPGTSMSYRPRPDSLGLMTIEVFDLRLLR